MWIVDSRLKELEEQGRPIRVGIVGAGFMCQGLANHIVHSVPGMRVVAISNRQVERARKVFSFGRVADRLRGEQYLKFRGEAWLSDLLDATRAQHLEPRASPLLVKHTATMARSAGPLI